MANWETKKIDEIVRNIKDEELVLPVIQRELVWSKDKIIALFQTLFMQNSFGGIMTARDPYRESNNRKPLFDYRKFENDYITGNNYFSDKKEFRGKDIVYVIDGQQRLSAFYIGLTGSYDGETLFFDLLGEYDNNEFRFAFSRKEKKLPSETFDTSDDKKRKTVWESVPSLFEQVRDGNDSFQIKERICGKYSQLDEDQRNTILKNITRFQSVISGQQCVGLCEVAVDRNNSVISNRLRIVRLFQRLNQGGTILSGIELMRSVLKAYDPSHQVFLLKVGKEYEDLDLNQDALMRFIFLLQDEPQKDIDEITEKDSVFIDAQQDRIFSCLDAMRNFLKRIRE